MAIHIDYDREENKIELILDSQGNVISILKSYTVNQFDENILQLGENFWNYHTVWDQHLVICYTLCTV